jgi:hypothetical protein
MSSDEFYLPTSEVLSEIEANKGFGVRVERVSYIVVAVIEYRDQIVRDQPRPPYRVEIHCVPREPEEVRYSASFFRWLPTDSMGAGSNEERWQEVTFGGDGIPSGRHPDEVIRWVTGDMDRIFGPR